MLEKVTGEIGSSGWGRAEHLKKTSEVILMIRAYKTRNEITMETSSLDEEDLWIDLVNPTEDEILEISSRFGIKTEYLMAPLDYDESSRIETVSQLILILVNIPKMEHKEMPVMYNTVPLGIVITDGMVITVSLEENQLIEELLKTKSKIDTGNRMHFVLQLLYNNAMLFLRYLKDIDKMSTGIEQNVRKSLRNEELIKLLNLEKSLVYFSTSLRSNEFVLERFRRHYLRHVREERSMISVGVLKQDEDDMDFLEDVIIENKQAIDMADIYSNILGNTMDAFATIISNNLNIVMKFLAIVTVVLAIPAIVTSFYGMNVPLPYQRFPLTYLGIVVLSCLMMIALAILINKKRS